MSCSGYFETLLDQANQESFSQQVLQEIQQLKTRLSKKLESLRVKGDFHKANQIKTKLEKLEKITARMRELLEA